MLKFICPKCHHLFEGMVQYLLYRDMMLDYVEEDGLLKMNKLIISWLRCFESLVSALTFNHINPYWSLDYWMWRRPKVTFNRRIK